MMKPLRLGKSSTENPVVSPPRRQSVPTSETPELPDVQLAYRQDGGLVSPRPIPSPPFRLLPPSSRPRSVSPHRPDEIPYGGSDFSRQHLAPPVDTVRRMEASEGFLDDRGDLRSQLRCRPLTHSFLGRKIVELLTRSWVIAPSGLAACCFPPEAPLEEVADVAGAINLLACGAEALAHPASGVLAIYNLERINLLLGRCGLSPIAPRPAPEHWEPLAARSPASFLLAGFQVRRLSETFERAL